MAGVISLETERRKMAGPERQMLDINWSDRVFSTERRSMGALRLVFRVELCEVGRRDHHHAALIRGATRTRAERVHTASQERVLIVDKENDGE